MSFSADVKNQVTDAVLKSMNNGPTGECCAMAAACGLLLYSRLTDGTNSRCRCDSEKSARMTAELIASRFGVYTEMEQQSQERFTVRIPESAQRSEALSRVNEYVSESGGAIDEKELCALLTRKIAARECCRGAFVRGAFLAAGTIAEPDKAYSLEFVVRGSDLRDALIAIMAEAGVKCGAAERSGMSVAYIHDSEGMENALALMGAGGAYFKLVDIKMERELKNNANRQLNCDSANISKTVAAAAQQLSAIKRLKQSGAISSLPPELREIAELRLENPEMSLRELGELLSEPLSRSGVNHRLKKIIELAE